MLSTQIFEHINPDIKKILNSALNSEELSVKDGIKANQICFEKKENIVTFVKNRNINFTNICYQKCKFCSFSVSKTDKNAFLLTLDEIREKVIEAKERGCTEICIQGGINPELNFDYYIEILKLIKAIDFRFHTHAFSPQEIFNISKLNNDTIENTLIDQKDYVSK